MKRNKILRMIAIGLLATGAFVLFLAGLTYLTMTLWNWLVPDLFAGPALTFYQTLGLLVLLKILLWPLGGGKRWSRHHGGPGAYWSAKWKSMTPEQRERLKARMQEKWCRPTTANDAEPGQPTGA